jgi:hypothetical protein
MAAFKNHNIVQGESSVRDIKEMQEGFWDRLADYLSAAGPELDDLKARYTNSEDYAVQLHAQLINKNIAADLDGNRLMIGPMDVLVQLEEYQIMIIIGRKKQRVTNLEIGKVTKLVEQIYRKLNSSFNANSYFKRVLKAYEFANTRMYASREVKYGFSVPLKDVFDLFTISPLAAEYKIENFLWDLGRLYALDTTFDNFRMELGFSRDARKMYIIKTGTGEALRASTLTIHKEAGNA